jgi:hypothetical protein
VRRGREQHSPYVLWLELMKLRGRHEDRTAQKSNSA